MKRQLYNGWSIEHRPSFPVLVMLGLFAKFRGDITLFKAIRDVLSGILQKVILLRRNLLDMIIQLKSVTKFSYVWISPVHSAKSPAVSTEDSEGQTDLVQT